MKPEKYLSKFEIMKPTAGILLCNAAHNHVNILKLIKHNQKHYATNNSNLNDDGCFFSLVLKFKLSLIMTVDNNVYLSV